MRAPLPSGGAAEVALAKDLGQLDRHKGFLKGSVCSQALSQISTAEGRMEMGLLFWQEWGRGRPRNLQADPTHSHMSLLAETKRAGVACMGFSRARLPCALLR